MDPARAQEIGATGLASTEDESWHVQEIHRAAMTVINGGSAEVPDEVDAGIAMRELRRIIPAFAESPGVDGLEMMLQHFQGELAAAPATGAPQQPQEGMAPPPEGMPQ